MNSNQVNQTSQAPTRHIINISHPKADDRFRSWAKNVTAYNPAKRWGYSIEGAFVSLDRLNPVFEGDIILMLGEIGSRAHRTPIVWLCKVVQGKLELVKEVRDNDWDFLIADELKRLLEEKKAAKAQAKEPVVTIQGADIDPEEGVTLTTTLERIKAIKAEGAFRTNEKGLARAIEVDLTPKERKYATDYSHLVRAIWFEETPS